MVGDKTIDRVLYLSHDDVQDCFVSNIEVRLKHISQLCGLYYKVDIDPSPHRYLKQSVQLRFDSLSEAIYSFEVSNLFASRPCTLQEWITNEASNYFALRSLSLSSSDTAIRRAPPQSHDNAPPNSFYFYTNPVEYFFDIASYTVTRYHEESKLDASTLKQHCRRVRHDRLMEEFTSALDVSNCMINYCK